VHVRVAGAANARYPLLFRDYLRADTTARDVWAVFKIRLAEIAENIDEYVDTKDPATDVLLLAAERWALETVWEPPS
jgi:dephospho-CoA kinase